MNIVPLTIERCKEILKKNLYFKKSCPGLTIGWKYYKIKSLDANKKTIITEPMDNSFCPNWNPLGRVKQRIEDVHEVKKESKRRGRKNNKTEGTAPEKKKRRRNSQPVKEEPKKKKRRRTT